MAIKNNTVKRGTPRTGNPVPSRQGVKISEEILQSLLAYRDSNLSIEEIADRVGVSYYTAHKYLKRPKLKRRTPSHMVGKTGSQHPNQQYGRIEPSGYQTISKPDWMTCKTRRVNTHVAVWCFWTGHTVLPSGCVVHHKDENKLNNSIDNLQLMTRAEHMNHHRKV